MIVDIAVPAQGGLAALSAAGVKTVIRYYARLTHHPNKILTRLEAQAVLAKQMSLAVVHEGQYGATASEFTQTSGFADGTYAREYAARIIGQPADSAIYFAADFDANDALVRSRVLPYFQGVAEAFAADNGLPKYKIGVYGCGTSCKVIKGAGLAAYTWLAQSTDFDGTKAYKASNDWTLLQEMPSTLGPFGVDVDDLNPAAADFGQFSALAGNSPMILPLAAAPAAPFAQRLVAVASSEWDFWGNQTYDVNGHRIKEGHTETEGPAAPGGPSWYVRVGQYFLEGCNVHGVDGRNTGMPWSAAFISWCEQTAGAGSQFLYSDQHSRYIYQGIRDYLSKRLTASYWTQRLEAYQPRPGDLVCWARAGGIDYDHQNNGDYPGHADVVVAVRPNEVDVIGGNVGNSVSKRTLALGAGYLVPYSAPGGDRLIAVMQCRIT